MTNSWRAIGLSVFLAVGATLGALQWSAQLGNPPSKLYAQQAQASQQAQAAQVSRPEVLAHADALSTAFRDVAKSLKPSVVSIKSIVTQKARPRVRGRQQLPPGIPENLFDLFRNDPFGDFGFQMPDDESNGPQIPKDVQAGLGSGVIVSANGFVLTNNHVVDGADKLEVQLSDNRTFEAKVVGTDKRSDIAVLKIEASGLVAASIGDSDLMQVGDWVVAIGSPFGLTQTVTSGIVSATNRDDQHITDYDNFIQTDAAINPGNSGGPLLNLHGQVIGINTAIASRSGSFNGIGFAIPSNMANQVMQSIIKEGKVVRGFIGTSIHELTSEIAASLGIPKETRGAYVAGVLENGPAAKAGLEPGDVVVAIDGEKIANQSQLSRKVANLGPGSRAKFEVNRKGKTLVLPLVIEEMTDEKLAAMASTRATNQLGITVEPLTEQIASRMGIRVRDGGVVVKEVADESAAYGNIRPGEVILQVNDTVVHTPQEFAKAIGTSKGVKKFLIRNEKQKRLLMLE